MESRSSLTSPDGPSTSASSFTTSDEHNHEVAVRAVLPDAPRSLLKQRAYDQLKQGIQEGVLESGSFLSERQLAVQLGMSKTPIKAALERLESEGFLLVSPQQGIVVRDLSVDEIADLYQVRLALESFVLRSVAGTLTAEQAGRIRENLQRQQLAAAGLHWKDAIELDAEFHAIFCECLGNQEIIRFMAHLRDKIHRVIRRVFQRHEKRIESSWQEHAAIAEAVLEGNGDLALQKLEEHLEYGRQLLVTPRG